MPAKKKGQPIGLVDEYLREICVCDEVRDAYGNSYTVDKNGWYKPLSGGTSCSPQKVGLVTITRPWNAEANRPKASAPIANVEPVKEDEEEAHIRRIHTIVKDAGDQTLFDELRDRGWKVTCTKVVEKIVYEEVAL